jgi:predicted DsbA family dithiol-disulfide isomerase
MLSVHMFSTSKCANCLPVKTALKTLEENYPELNVSYTVVDQEVDGMLKAQEWGITAVPTLIFITDATERMRKVGAMPMSELETYVQGYLQRDVFQEPSRGSEQGSGPLLCGVSREEDTES